MAEDIANIKINDSQAQDAKSVKTGYYDRLAAAFMLHLLLSVLNLKPAFIFRGT